MKSRASFIRHSTVLILYVAIVLLLVIHVLLVVCIELSSLVLAPLSSVSLRGRFARCVARNCVDQSCVLCEIVSTNHVLLCETVLTNQTNEMAMQALMAAGGDLVDTRPALNTLSARVHDSSPLDKWSNLQACFCSVLLSSLKTVRYIWRLFLKGCGHDRLAGESRSRREARSTMSDSFLNGC